MMFNIQLCYINVSSTIQGQFNLYLFMDTTLSVMYSHLKYDAFYIILRHMWVVLLYRLRRGQSFKVRYNYFICAFNLQQKRINIFILLTAYFDKLFLIFLLCRLFVLMIRYSLRLRAAVPRLRSRLENKFCLTI